MAMPTTFSITSAWPVFSTGYIPSKKAPMRIPHTIATFI